MPSLRSLLNISRIPRLFIPIGGFCVFDIVPLGFYNFEDGLTRGDMEEFGFVERVWERI